MRRPLFYLVACLIAAGTATATPAVAVGREAAVPRAASGADWVSRHPFGVGRWMGTGMMAYARVEHTATALGSGKVLVVGGSWAEAELYDPAVGTWRRTGSMRSRRVAHTATLLPSGKVLVAGGEHYVSGLYRELATAELYDPATRRWTATGTMHNARVHHQATLLPNGTVLVEGGIVNRTAELYDPATGRWTMTGSMTTQRFDHTATALPDGKVLVAGGSAFTLDQFFPGWTSSAEVYDPTTGR